MADVQRRETGENDKGKVRSEEDEGDACRDAILFSSRHVLIKYAKSRKLEMSGYQNDPIRITPRRRVFSHLYLVFDTYLPNYFS